MKIPLGPWHTQPELWDRLTIGDKLVPGIATVEVDRANKWDSKKAKGEHGQEREFSGVEAAKVRIQIVYWTDEQWQEIKTEILPLIEPNPEKKKIDSLSINHEVANARKVARITVDSVKGPSVSGGLGTIDVDATEYREPSPKNATGTATGKGGGSGGAGTKGGACADLANQIVQTQIEITNEQIQLNTAYAKLASTEFLDFLAFDLQDEIGQREARIAELNQQINALQQQQIAIGCSGDTGTGASTSPETQGPEEFYGLV